MACVAKRRGRWVIDFRDNAGRRRWETFDTRKEAEAALAERQRDLRRGVYCAPGEVPTLREVAEAWLANKSDRRPATISFWENQVHRHIIPALGARKVSTVTAADVESFRDQLRTKPRMSPGTVNRVLTTLAAIFNRAARERYIEANPAALAERCRTDSEEAHDDAAVGLSYLEIDPSSVPTPEEVGRLIAAAEEGLFRTYFMTAAMTGARPEELLALGWDCVDLEARTVTVRVAISWARTRAEREAKLKGPRFFAPKTKASRRVIPIPTELAKALRPWKLQCPPSERRLVFPMPDGSPMHGKVLYDYGLLPALERGKLRHFTVYSLRHFFASTLAMHGRPATEVAHYLGHASPAVTQAVYQHWFPQARTDAVEDLAATILSGPQARFSA